MKKNRIAFNNDRNNMNTANVSRINISFTLPQSQDRFF